MSKKLFFQLFIFFFSLFFILLFFSTNVRAQEDNCVPDPPDGLCSTDRPCCNYPDKPVRVCRSGYCVSEPSLACIPETQSCDPSNLCCSPLYCIEGYCKAVPIPPQPGASPGSNAAVSFPSINDQTDLATTESKEVSITSLSADTTYVLVVKKRTLASYLPRLPFQNEYSLVNSFCLKSDSKGQISKTLPPFRSPGYYLLEISKETSPNSCAPSGNVVKSQEFKVGGATDINCCVGNTPIYNKSKDDCQKEIGLPIIGRGATNPTECKSQGLFCEPQSLKCFKTKTFLIGAKICMDPDTVPNDLFDPANNKGTDIYAICGEGGGETVKGCTDDPAHPAIATAIGCVHTNPAEFVKDLLTWVIGIGGGIAFLMMVLGAFQMLTSDGNPETLQAGRDRLTSAVIGLLFIIFSVLLLQIIGIGILNIPGFQK